MSNTLRNQVRCFSRLLQDLFRNSCNSNDIALLSNQDEEKLVDLLSPKQYQAFFECIKRAMFGDAHELFDLHWKEWISANGISSGLVECFVQLTLSFDGHKFHALDNQSSYQRELKGITKKESSPKRVLPLSVILRI